MHNKPTSSMKRRLNGFIAFMLVAFTVWIVFNLFESSVTNSEEYQAFANAQQFSSTTINANRGTIYASDMQILAQSATVYTVAIDPVTLNKNDLTKKDLIVDKLSELLEIDKEDIEYRCTKNSQYEILKRKVEKTLTDQINEFVDKEHTTCIRCDPDTKRYYPQNELAAAVIGFTGFDGHGQYGLESQYDEYLSGIDGRIISAKDAMGADMPYRYEQSFDAQNGYSLVLNIDLTLQSYLERELTNAVAEHNPKNRACGIIMNPKTGQVLAMATVPGYDLNNPTEITDQSTLDLLATLGEGSDEYKKQRAIAWEKQWKNKAITELYNPGSVFKVITGSSALEDKAITLTDTFYCNGSIDVLGTTFHCWNGKSHGSQNFVEAMTHSCNPAFVQIGQRLGIERFGAYFSAYGLDTTTGIDLPGEATSIYHKAENMTLIDLAACSFGQSNKITPMEMITAYAAVINGGKLVTPYVVNKVIDDNGNIIKQYEPTIKRQVISEETSKIMRETLETVVNVNGGSNAYIQGYRIGGKSGTSQKIDEYGEAGKQIYVSSYVGFAPADDPDIIMLVMVDEPSNGDYFGSRVAAPVVSAVFKEALPYLGYLPEYTQEEYEQMAVTLPDVTDSNYGNAYNTLNALEIANIEKVGDGDTVLKQVPAAGQTMPRTGRIILYTEETADDYVTVPDVHNMTLTQANKAITDAGLNFMPTGGAANHTGSYAVAQDYTGEKVLRGTIIEVNFVSNDETG